MNRLIINTLLLLTILSKSATPATAKNIWQGCASVTEIPSVECEALVDLYNSTNGPKWKNNKGWLQNNTPCRWHGVSCRSGNVIQILLQDNKLKGNIPASLGKISDLHTLWLGKNLLSGSIPKEFGNFSSLKSLLLDNNNLSGSIPQELGDLSSIETIWLSNNKLSGEIPPALGRLSTLKTLSLDNNRLSGSIPAELGNLASLETLSLGNNKLTGKIPKEMGNLSSLRKISTYNNKLDDKVSWELTVNSSGVEGWAPTIGVPISANLAKYSGHTSYSVNNIASGTLIHLKAPASTGIWPWKKNLVSWTGCDFMFGRTCTVKMLANKTVTANYDPEAEALPDSCDAMDIVLENPEGLDVVYTMTKYDPIGRSGEYVGNRDGVHIPASVIITSKAEELRAVEWRSKADIPIYVVITAEKCDGNSTREIHPLRIGGMIQEDSTPFSEMKAKVTVKVVSSLSDAEKMELREY